MTLQDLSKLKEIARKELKFTDDGLQSKIANQPIYTQKWLDLLLKEKHILSVIEAEKDKVYGKLYHKYKYESDFRLDTRGEIDVYVKADDAFDIVLKKYNESLVIVEWLDETLKNFRAMAWSMKNHLDLRKFLSGM